MPDKVNKSQSGYRPIIDTANLVKTPHPADVHLPPSQIRAFNSHPSLGRTIWRPLSFSYYREMLRISHHFHIIKYSVVVALVGILNFLGRNSSIYLPYVMFLFLSQPTFRRSRRRIKCFGNSNDRKRKRWNQCVGYVYLTRRCRIKKPTLSVVKML